VETVYYGDVRKEWDKDCRVGQEWVHAFPRDVIARTNFSSCLERLGSHDEQLVQSREAVRLLPSEPTLMHLLIAAIDAQRIDEAKETYDELISRGMDSLRLLHLYHALLAFLQNDKPEMQKEWAWASQDPVRGRWVLFIEAKIESFYGRSREARKEIAGSGGKVLVLAVLPRPARHEMHIGADVEFRGHPLAGGGSQEIIRVQQQHVGGAGETNAVIPRVRDAEVCGPDDARSGA